MQNLPVELQLQIASFLDVETILSLRKTCTSLSQFTHARSLWLSLMSRMPHALPWPRSESDTATLSSLQLEHMIKTAVRVEQIWLLPRKDSFLVQDRYDSDDTVGNSIPRIRHLAFIFDQYLLALGSEGKINLWKISDVFAPFAAEVVVTYASSTWYPSAYHLNAVGSVLAIVLTHVELIAARVLTISLDALNSSESGSPRLVTQGEFSIFPPQVIRAIDADLELALLSNTASSFDVVNWRTKAQATVALRANDPGDLWNGITAMRICGPYILVFRMHTVEAYPLPPHITFGVEERSDILPQLTFRFPHTMTYRRVSLTRNTCAEDDEPEIYELSALANDLFHGIFHFHVKLTVHPLPSLSVSPLGVRPMAITSPQFISATLPVDFPPPLALPVPFGTVQDTRTFVSVWALGDHGRRGVWVARSRTNMSRSVVAFTNPRDVSNTVGEARIWSNDSLQANDDPERPRLIDGQVIHNIPLRDDITVCAVSETTGKIALGSWAGSITMI
ncbi:uncharacterized protein EDB91DRAFT_1336920 [Suillus paluster]|uniref:uncharacterized protein n=1 Tax=Suillus paluster TaxID=48578 RepID=UPI001B86028D|nr:uncharacterized protein EDB91DRAFT_1336920 [Suillus paluster]KAG1738856.1 hypothetical protein EDB91DRAFT_1336920 [Suillus paluster]